jgi:hypothetical protein
MGEADILAHIQKMSQAELQVLLERLVRQQPTIQPLLTTLLQVPATEGAATGQQPGAGRVGTLDPATISSQVATVFSQAGRGWEAANYAALELNRLCEIGDRFSEAGQWANAQVVYATIADAILPSYEELEDEVQIAGVLENCSIGLIDCLEAQESLPLQDRLDEEQRKVLLTSLFALWQFDAEYGTGESDLPEVLARATTASERTLLKQWVQQDMQGGAGSRQARHLLDMLAEFSAANGQ